MRNSKQDNVFFLGQNKSSFGPTSLMQRKPENVRSTQK